MIKVHPSSSHKMSIIFSCIVSINPYHLTMRYLLVFKDGTHMTLSQKEGEAVVKAKIENRNFALRGAAYDVYGVDRCKPYNRDNFPSDQVEMMERRELANPEERQYLIDLKILPPQKAEDISIMNDD